MAQLWVNLPAKYKMIPPRYQPLRNNDIPRVELPDGAGTVKLYAGELAGTKGVCAACALFISMKMLINY